MPALDLRIFLKRANYKHGANQFKGNKPAAFCDRPMRWCESTLKFYSKLENLFLSVENFLAEIDEQGLAKNAQQAPIYPAHFIKKKSLKRNY